MTAETLKHLKTLGKLRDQFCNESQLLVPPLRPVMVRLPDRIDPQQIREKLAEQIEALNFAIKRIKFSCK